MRHWATWAWGVLAAPVCLSLAWGLTTTLNPISGKAYITQSGAVTAKEAENYFGENWDSVRTFRLQNALNAPLRVYVNTRSDLYKPAFQDYIAQSLTRWSDALDGRLTYVFTSRRDQADITVDWVSSFGDKYVAGITTYSIGHAKVEIRTMGIPEKDIKANIIHEFGHALGISGHSPNAGDIMVATRRWRREDSSYDPTLSRRDIQAIRLLYSSQWHKGEDLYTANAQNSRIIASQNDRPVVNVSRMPIKRALRGVDETPVLVWNIPQPATATSNVIRQTMQKRVFPLSIVSWPRSGSSSKRISAKQP